MKNNLSLYAHIPFCSSKCDYCDFYSIQIPSRRGAEAQSFFKNFFDVLICDLYEQVERYKVDRIPTVYIGGGTPSVPGTDIKILLDALKNLPAFTPEEFTVEANPDSLTEDFLAVLRENGVTRLSLGVQTFYEPSRRSVNRAGNIAVIEKALSLSKQYFPDDLSVDMITGLPFQNKSAVKEDINRILHYEPAHISLYSLTLETKTELYKKLKNNIISLPDHDKSDSLWLTARDALANAGFKHYEVSNFARENKECKHNKRYWRMEGWLGAGPSASGTVINGEAGTALRYTYANDMETYLGIRDRGLGAGVIYEELNREQLLREIIMMGYRYCEGPDPIWEAEKHIPQTLKKWKNKDIMLLLNSFLIDAFKELDHRMNANIHE